MLIMDVKNHLQKFLCVIELYKVSIVNDSDQLLNKQHKQPKSVSKMISIFAHLIFILRISLIGLKVYGWCNIRFQMI